VVGASVGAKVVGAKVVRAKVVGAKVDWHIELALNDNWELTLIESESQLFQVGFAEASAELGIVPTFMLEVIVLISGDTDWRAVTTRYNCSSGASA